MLREDQACEVGRSAVEGTARPAGRVKDKWPVARSCSTRSGRTVGRAGQERAVRATSAPRRAGCYALSPPPCGHLVLEGPGGGRALRVGSFLGGTCGLTGALTSDRCFWKPEISVPFQTATIAISIPWRPLHVILGLEASVSMLGHLASM